MTVWEPRSNLGASYCNITVLVASRGLSDQSAKDRGPRIESAVHIYRNCLLITRSSCTRVQTYLRFKLRFKPSAYLYLRTCSKTKDCHLGLLQSLLVPFSSLFICLPRGLVSVHTYKGSQVSSCLVLVSRSVLVLSQPSDIIDLVPLCLVSTDPTLSPESSSHHQLPKSGVRL